MSAKDQLSWFGCDGCGACCRSLIVEADHTDCMREPRLLSCKPGEPMSIDNLRSGTRCVVLYNIGTKQCPFLTSDCKCEIYPTRPNACVMVEAGDAKCQQARLQCGLPLLRDVNGDPPTREMLDESCDDYDMDFNDFFGDQFKG